MGRELELHGFDALDETPWQAFKRPGQREPRIRGAVFGKITRIKKIAVLEPMLNGDLHRTVSSREVNLKCETAFQEGSDRRLWIPADRHTRRDGLGLADDVQALWCAISEEMRAEEIEFSMVGDPVGPS
jgi:hypothetical protein